MKVIALVGAGGKTSLMYALAREIVAVGSQVITTTSTKIFPPLPDQSPALLLVAHDPFLTSLSKTLEIFRHVTVAHRVDPVSGKALGITQDIIDVCAQAADWVIVEADGAAGHSVKAPESWEPVIPPCTDLVIPVVGLDCLGKPASNQWVFRLERFLEITGMKAGEIITAPTLATLVCHEFGGLKDVPPDASFVPFLNKADQVQKEASIEELVSEFTGRKQRIKRLVVGQLKPQVQARHFFVSELGRGG